MSVNALGAAAVQPLEGHSEVTRSLDALMAGTHYEFLSALPEGSYDVEMLRSSWDYDVAMMARGVELRVIYPANIARRPEIMEYLTQFAARGARVRVLGSVPHRLVIADRQRAIVPETPETPTGRALLVSGKVLVRALYNDFLGLWRASTPVGFSTGGLDVDLIRSTLRALSEGLTDEAAARKYRWSLRTYRRRIAAVMDLLGTTSRFEAGILAREQGWI